MKRWTKRIQTCRVRRRSFLNTRSMTISIVVTAPEPRTVLEALQQRHEDLTKRFQDATSKGDSAKARRLDRLAKVSTSHVHLATRTSISSFANSNIKRPSTPPEKVDLTTIVNCPSYLDLRRYLFNSLNLNFNHRLAQSRHRYGHRSHHNAAVSSRAPSRNRHRRSVRHRAPSTFPLRTSSRRAR